MIKITQNIYINYKNSFVKRSAYRLFFKFKGTSYMQIRNFIFPKKYRHILFFTLFLFVSHGVVGMNSSSDPISEQMPSLEKGIPQLPSAMITDWSFIIEWDELIKHHESLEEKSLKKDKLKEVVDFEKKIKGFNWALNQLDKVFGSDLSPQIQKFESVDI